VAKSAIENTTFSRAMLASPFFKSPPPGGPQDNSAELARERSRETMQRHRREQR
jgi:hypothetical protein